MRIYPEKIKEITNKLNIQIYSKMEKTLYEISNEYVDLMSEVELNEGELTPELEAALQINEQDYQQKMEAYAACIANYKAEAEACKNEAKRLREKGERALNVVERLKSTMMFFMQATDRKKVDAGQWKMSLRETKAVNVLDETLVPDTHIRTKVETSVDKVAVEEAIANGKAVEGCELITNTSIQIK